MPDRVKEKLVELLDNFHRDLSPFAGNEKLFVVDDNIEQAEYLIAHGVTVQQWIPVTERLPEENERVLACYINPLRKDRPPRMMVGEGTSTQIVKGKVYLWCGGWRSITHWMPLPQPPKGE